MSEFSIDRQQQRLAFIDLCAYVLGYVTRGQLMTRFNIKQATASSDLTTYQQHSNNLTYDHRLRSYKPVVAFSPLYPHSLADALLLITEGKQQVICDTRKSELAYGFKLPIAQPELIKVNAVLRALTTEQLVEIEYISRNSGHSTRKIIPHTLILTGSFSYIRGFDRLRGEFRTFKLNRIIKSSLQHSITAPSETADQDVEWQQDIELTITSNDAHGNEAVDYDYGLINNQRVIRLKKAVLMYFLMDWNIAPLGFEQLPSLLFPLKVESIKELGIR